VPASARKIVSQTSSSTARKSAVAAGSNIEDPKTKNYRIAIECVERATKSCEFDILAETWQYRNVWQHTATGISA
jgi:hypothetical protein